jgi:hypothetical protein
MESRLSDSEMPKNVPYGRKVQYCAHKSSPLDLPLWDQQPTDDKDS